MTAMDIYYWPITREYVDTLTPDARAQIESSIAAAARVAGDVPEGTGIALEGTDVLVARVIHELDSEPFLEVEVTDETRDRVLAILKALPKPEERRLSRDEAIAAVRAGIGKRPDLPSGAEYVDNLRHMWKGLTPRADRSA